MTSADRADDLGARTGRRGRQGLHRVPFVKGVSSTFRERSNNTNGLLIDPAAVWSHAEGAESLRTALPVTSKPQVTRPDFGPAPSKCSLTTIKASHSWVTGLGGWRVISRPRVHYNFSPGRSADGMSIDAQGSLYASARMNHKLIPIAEDFITNKLRTEIAGLSR